MTHYPLHGDSPRIGVRNLTRQCYHLSRLPFKFLSYKSHLSCDQLTYSNSNEHMSNSTKGIIMAIDFIITSFGSPKRTHYLNPMRHHGASIENNYCHQPPPIVTQFIGIYSHFRISPISQSLLLILAQTQYPLEVESSYSIVAW